MPDDQHETDAPPDSQDARKAWVAPTLTDVGSFEEVTQTGLSGVADIEGQS